MTLTIEELIEKVEPFDRSENATPEETQFRLGIARGVCLALFLIHDEDCEKKIHNLIKFFNRPTGERCELETTNAAM